ncbi:unnamed protein product [Heligmosomoides polygyrus]|uniref:Protein ARV n=1 Tax=Heligmosomoides polygyrus TaxID=6339 RepID=A0A183F9J9_HELPZ|nr:unnamed protein product [Heligmosomoides polygyrus]
MCVNCMEPAVSLYQRYSEGVIRLSDCKGCGEVVDKYVEYDTMLVVIDLIIHNISAYRHLLYNMRIQVWNLEEKAARRRGLGHRIRCLLLPMLSICR